MRLVALLVVVAILLYGCTQPPRPLPTINPTVEVSVTPAPTDDLPPPPPDDEIELECTTASDCMVGGCSSTLCATPEYLSQITTTCEWKEEYACYKQIGCGCINNQCSWVETTEFKFCVDAARKIDQIEDGGLPPLPE